MQLTSISSHQRDYFFPSHTVRQTGIVRSFFTFQHNEIARSNTYDTSFSFTVEPNFLISCVTRPPLLIVYIDRPFLFRPHIEAGPLNLDSKSNYFLNMSNYWRLSYFLLPIAIQQLVRHDFNKLFFRELLELLLINFEKSPFLLYGQHLDSTNAMTPEEMRRSMAHG